MIKELVKILVSSSENILYPGASEKQIKGLETKLNLSLPESFRTFLLQTNGALIRQTDLFYGTIYEPNGIRSSIDFIKMNTPGLPDSLLPFFESGFLWCFNTSKQNKDEYPIVSWRKQTKEIRQESDNFERWLKEYVEDNY